MPGVKATMHEFKAGRLHSGSKAGPKVTSRAQAIAIGLSEARKAGERIPAKKGKGKKAAAKQRRIQTARGLIRRAYEHSRED